MFTPFRVFPSSLLLECWSFLDVFYSSNVMPLVCRGWKMLFDAPQSRLGKGWHPDEYLLQKTRFEKQLPMEDNACPWHYLVDDCDARGTYDACGAHAVYCFRKYEEHTTYPWPWCFRKITSPWVERQSTAGATPYFTSMFTDDYGNHFMVSFRRPRQSSKYFCEIIQSFPPLCSIPSEDREAWRSEMKMPVAPFELRTTHMDGFPALPYNMCASENWLYIWGPHYVSIVHRERAQDPFPSFRNVPIYTFDSNSWDTDSDGSRDRQVTCNNRYVLFRVDCHFALFRTGSADDPLPELFSFFDLDWLTDRLIPFPSSMKLPDSHGSSTKACFILEGDIASFVAFAYAPGKVIVVDKWGAFVTHWRHPTWSFVAQLSSMQDALFCIRNRNSVGSVSLVVEEFALMKPVRQDAAEKTHESEIKKWEVIQSLLSLSEYRQNTKPPKKRRKRTSSVGVPLILRGVNVF